MSLATDPGMSAAIEMKSFASAPTVTVSIPTFSGIVADEDMCGIYFQDNNVSGTGVLLTVSSQGGQLVAKARSFEGATTTDTLVGSGSSSADLSGTLFLKLSQSGSSFAASYRVGSSGDFTTFVTITQALSSTVKAGLGIDSNGSGTTNCQFSNFTVSGTSASGQD
jgi:hypothetical protein